MKESILVPLDGSDLAEVALPQAVALARMTGRSLTLLRVAPLPVAYSQAVWGAPVPTSTWEAAEEEPKRAREYLEKVAAMCAQSSRRGLGQSDLDFEVNTQVLEGDPASEITEYVEKHLRVRAIVMATHARRGIARWVFGSVAERILQTSTVPLLLVRATKEDVVPPLPVRPLDEVAYRTIVVPLDGSSFAEIALEQAQQIAAASGAKLVLMSALPEYPPLPDALTREEVQSLWNREYEWRTSYLEEVKARLHAEGLEVDTHIVCESPSQAILDLSARERADLIVMSTHGTGGLRRLWLGSVASEVIRRATQPLLLIRATVQVEPSTPDRKEAELATKR